MTEQYPPMHRSITQPAPLNISESLQQHASSVSLIKEQQQQQDDTAYIFNRSSLHECLLNPRSFRGAEKSSSNYASFMKRTNMNLLAGNVGRSSVGGSTSSSSGGSSNSRNSCQVMEGVKAGGLRELRNVRPSNLPINLFKKETSI